MTSLLKLFSMDSIVAASKDFDAAIARCDRDIRSDMIQRGNTDIAQGFDWLPPIAARPVAPLPIYPTPGDLALIGCAA